MLAGASPGFLCSAWGGIPKDPDLVQKHEELPALSKYYYEYSQHILERGNRHPEPGDEHHCSGLQDGELSEDADTGDGLGQDRASHSCRNGAEG